MVNFILPTSFEIEVLLEKINHVFTVIPESTEQSQSQYFDTYDWRLYQNDLTLYQKKTTLHLEKISNQAQVLAPFEISGEIPTFWWDFPESQFKEKLRPAIKVRALIPLFECKRSSKRFRILNSYQKTVLWLTIVNIQIKGKTNASSLRLLTISPLRGYDAELEKLISLFDLSELEKTSNNQFELFLKAAGRLPVKHSSNLSIELHPQMTGLQATRSIFQFLFHVMLENEGGVKADIDTEFLHDFRVSIRRTRSALTQIKGILPIEIVDRFKNDFAYIGRSTNMMRDLDVYLLKENEYKQMVPDIIHPGLNDFFVRLKKQRKTELAKMLRVLNSKRYERIINAWHELIEDDDKNFPETENGTKPVLGLSKTLILKRYKKVLKEGKEISYETPDEKVHELRIDCKKLRYLIEFFASLYPELEIARLVKQLKRLQDNLGEFNDFSVQQDNVNQYLEKFKTSKTVKAETLVAMGGLITVLNEKQHSARAGFSKAFSKFASKNNQKLFTQLFENGDGN